VHFTKYVKRQGVEEVTGNGRVLAGGEHHLDVLEDEEGEDKEGERMCTNEGRKVIVKHRVQVEDGPDNDVGERLSGICDLKVVVHPAHKRYR